MLYTLIGNGNCNKKEVISSLTSLLDAAGGAESFALILPEEHMPSETLQEVFKWVKKEGVYYESVISADEGGMARGFYEQAEEVYQSKRPLDRAIKLTPARKAPDEDCALLVLSDDIEEDDGVLYAISKAIDMDIPVYDLGGQMVQIIVEEEQEETPLKHPEPEEFVLPHNQEDEDSAVEFTRSDLEGLTRDELKSLVQSRGVVPKDMRSKDSLIDALMGASERPVQESVQEEVASDSRSFYLLVISATGETEMRPLSAEQAALVA